MEPSDSPDNSPGERGYVSTFAADGRPLTIYWIHESPRKSDFVASVKVLQDFAAAWTTGQPDVNGKAPYPDTHPCDIIVVAANNHVSTSDNTMHMTVNVASVASWAAGYAKACPHVYYNDNILKNGYSSWKNRAKPTKQKYDKDTVKYKLEEAKTRNIGAGVAGEIKLAESVEEAEEAESSEETESSEEAE